MFSDTIYVFSQTDLILSWEPFKYIKKYWKIDTKIDIFQVWWVIFLKSHKSQFISIRPHIWVLFLKPPMTDLFLQTPALV